MSNSEYEPGRRVTVKLLIDDCRNRRKGCVCELFRLIRSILVW